MFRHIYSETIEAVKKNIRDQYNPYKDGKRTENHIVHISDNPFQALKFLESSKQARGLKEVISSSGQLFPSHITRPNLFRVAPLDLESIVAKVVTDEGVVELPLDETPHHLALKSGRMSYDNHIMSLFGTHEKGGHNWANFTRLLDKAQQGQMFNPVIVVGQDNNFVLRDGVHRAAVAKFMEIPRINAIEIEG